MTNILVTGANGQLGSVVKELSGNYDGHHFTFVDIQELDLTDDKSLSRYFEKNHFDFIINCAAYTAVDQAETQLEKAFAINAGIPAKLGTVCARNSSFLIHLSTDYVYNGKKSVPHQEDEVTDAISVYAKSKLEGELNLLGNPNALIIRTSWLYSEYGNNFLKTMMRLGTQKDEVSVVFDQTGTPTYAGDLAEAIMHVIDFSVIKGFKPGIYNFSNEGVCSWFDFATEIMDLTGSKCRVKPVKTSEYPAVATRPEYSVLDKHKIKSTFGLQIPYWRNSLIKVLNKLNDFSSV